MELDIVIRREIEELEQTFVSAIELLEKYREKNIELQAKLDIEVKKYEELKKNEASSGHMTPLYPEFSHSEIEEATSNFDASMKLGEGRNWRIYTGILRHTDVAIKILDANSLHGPSEFQHKVDVLGKLKHPKLVKLIGACAEAWALVCEYLPNGSLKDRLSCKDNTPLSWKIRVCIATELCSAIRFIHSFNIVDGDLKPDNVLLDLNFIAKLGDFGISRSLLAYDGSSSSSTTLCHRTEPKGTFAYMDPEFMASRELTTKSDVYSFGVILLQLLSGRPALGIIKEVESAYKLD